MFLANTTIFREQERNPCDTQEGNPCDTQEGNPYDTQIGKIIIKVKTNRLQFFIYFSFISCLYSIIQLKIGFC